MSGKLLTTGVREGLQKVCFRGAEVDGGLCVQPHCSTDSVWERELGCSPWGGHRDPWVHRDAAKHQQLSELKLSVIFQITAK